MNGIMQKNNYILNIILHRIYKPIFYNLINYERILQRKYYQYSLKLKLCSGSVLIYIWIIGST